jgi:hypothetical protein
MALMQTKYWPGFISAGEDAGDEADLSGGEWASESAGKGETCEGTRGPIPAHFEDSLIGPCARASSSRSPRHSSEEMDDEPLDGDVQREGSTL